MLGGKRAGAGRKKGEPNKPTTDIQIARDLVSRNSPELIQKALTLALAKKCNVAVLMKLLDKILPNLQSGDIDATIKGNIISKLDENQIKNMIATIASRVNDDDKA